MGINEHILHNVGGVKSMTVSGRFDDFEAVAECGIGRVRIFYNPTIAFTRGVVCFEMVSGKAVAQEYCDDPQLVASYIEALKGYDPYGDGRWRLHDDPEFDNDNWPSGAVPVLPEKDALWVFVNRKIPHPGRAV